MNYTNENGRGFFSFNLSNTPVFWFCAHLAFRVRVHLETGQIQEHFPCPIRLKEAWFSSPINIFSEPSYLLGRMEADLISKCKVTMGNYDSMIKARRCVKMWGTNWPFVILQEWKLCATELVEFPINNAPVYLYDLGLTPLPAWWEPCNSSSF